MTMSFFPLLGAQSKVYISLFLALNLYKNYFFIDKAIHKFFYSFLFSEYFINFILLLLTYSFSCLVIR